MKTSGNRNAFNTMSYIAFLIIALLIIVDNFLPLIGVEINGGFLGVFMNVLETIKNIFILVVVGVAAYNFIGGKKKWVKVLYWIALVVFIVGAVLLWL